MGFLRCVVYLAIVGVASFLLGRLLPKRWFHGDAFPFRCYGFEQEGRIYEKLNIKQWQKIMPDMSKILPWSMPAKKLDQDFTPKLPRMVQETCVAEWIHVLLCFLGFGCIRLWPGLGGIIVTISYILLGNVPFILIQRYNRPRLQRLLKKTKGRGDT